MDSSIYMAPVIHSTSALLLCTAKALLVFLIATTIRLTVSTPAAGSNADKPTLTFCSGQSPYFMSSPVVTKAELTHFLNTLSAGASRAIDKSYSMSSYVTDTRTMYGVAQCRPDVPVSHCAACLTACKQFIVDGVCAATAVWHDACFLRYSDNDTSHFDEEDYTASVFNTSRVLYGEKAVVTGLLDAVVDSTIKTDTHSIGCGTAAGQVYSLARCIPGITRADCARCLRGALAAVEREYNGSAGMQVLRLNCTARYETYPFYNASLLEDIEYSVSSAESVDKIYGGRISGNTVGGGGSIAPNFRPGTIPIPPDSGGRIRIPRGGTGLPPSPSPAPPMPSPPGTARAAAPRGGTGLPPPPSPALPPTSHGRRRKTLILLIVLITTGVATGGTLLFFWSYRKRQKNRRDVDGMPREDLFLQGEEHRNADDKDVESTSCQPQPYSYKILDLEPATSQIATS